MMASEITDIRDRIKEIVSQLREDEKTTFNYRKGNILYINGQAQLLSQLKSVFEISIDDEYNDFKVRIDFDEKIAGDCSCRSKEWCHHRVAAILQISESLGKYDADGKPEGKEYTREGMISRVLQERIDKAAVANYKIRFADNIHGEHLLINEKDKRYKITLRDIKKENGYCSCKDYRTNRLGTCKHLVFTYNQIRKNEKFTANTQDYPFLEIYLDPLNNYKIAWYYPHELSEYFKGMLETYFGKGNVIEESKTKAFLGFIQKAEGHKQILIRPEVFDVLEDTFNTEIIEKVKAENELDFSLINAKLYHYQKQGIEFATFRKGAIIADEMGLGKTIQAIGTAIYKKKLFGFRKTLVICPASLKVQWKSEIEKFTTEKAEIVEGFPDEREDLYLKSEAYFIIANYESVLRDTIAINKANFDFIILDEAQRIKNYETITANAIKSLQKNMALLLQEHQ